MVLLNIEKESKLPIFKQVLEQLKEKIDNEVFKPGEKLPSSRTLSNLLGVNRTTIYKAYQELWALGYIESRSGSYSYIRQRRDNNYIDGKLRSSIIDWSQKVNPNAEKVYKLFDELGYPFNGDKKHFDGIDFSTLHPDPRIFPIKEFKKSLNKVIEENPKMIFDYGESRGFLPLRENIAHRLQLHGISVAADEILITSGAQNAIDLLVKLLGKQGGRVFVESPTYGMVIPTFMYYGCEIVGIPMNDEGIDLTEVEKEFKNGLPAFLYTMPNFQNPTGITTSQQHREKLIALFEKYSVPIIEDAFEEEMKYFGKVPLPIKAMDINQIVMYVGSFSKILFPGIRIGWIAANKECISRLAALKRCSDMNTTLPDQVALAHFCNQGFYELHIKRIHKIYRKLMILILQLLESSINNKNVSWIEPNGGFTLWLTLKNIKFNYDELENIFNSFKIRLAIGKNFFPKQNNLKCYRLSISGLNENEIPEGIKRLSEAINYIYNKC
ncbi:MAG: PLP-dependent aminotransferase family protein [bacterium]